MQDCKGEEQNDWIEMKEKKKAEHRESTGEGSGGGEEGGKNSHNEDKCIMKWHL